MISLIFIIFSISCLIWYKLTCQKRPPLPPGPSGDPLIGHLRVIPPVGQDTFFYNLGKVHGDVMHFSILGRSMIILNSTQAAADLLDKRSANYSDRPYLPIFELMGFQKNIAFMRYGEDFQLHRRMCQQYLNKDASITYRPIHTREAHSLVQKLLDKPELHAEHFIRFSLTVMMQIAFGYQITSDSDPYLKLAEEFCDVLANCGPPGGTLIDLFPFFQYLPSWFPGTHYADYARSKEPLLTKLREYPFTEVQKQMTSGVARESFLVSKLESLDDNELKNPEIIQHIKGVASALYQGGTETTSATLSHFLLAILLHPEYQTKAQEEIDMVIGPGRLPEFNDRPSLPYLECILQETLRWNQAAPLGIPHRSLADDIYKGMFIPKGSLVMANARAMTLDENVYTDPFRFNPSRYFPKPEGLGEPHPIGPFGFGRRVCPGRHLASDSLWMAMATILATISISKAIDKDGKEIIPELAFVSGATSHPRPFLCHLQPRSDTAQSLIAHANISYSY